MPIQCVSSFFPGVKFNDSEIEKLTNIHNELCGGVKDIKNSYFTLKSIDYKGGKFYGAVDKKHLNLIKD